MKKLWRSGEPFIWLTGGALALALIMVAGLIGIILVNALGFFWPADVVRATLTDGSTLTGHVVDRERVPGTEDQSRLKLKVGNRDLYGGADFVWVDEAVIARRDDPPTIAVVERTEWGLLIGTLTEVRWQDTTVARGPEASWAEVRRRLPEVTRVRREIRRIETGEIGGINHAQEQIRLRMRGYEQAGVTGGPAVETLRQEFERLQARYDAAAARLAALRTRQTETLVVSADGGKTKELPLAQVIDVYFPNAMGVPAKSAHYVAKVWEFVSDDPRESNTEGGVFPAIFGTVMLVMIM
ncbi:MAG: phosphate ABC transporter permease PstA, partial [Candidatus Rokuibacteriota bacterium]